VTACHPDVPAELKAEVDRLRRRMETLPDVAQIAAARALATDGMTAARIDALAALRVQADDLLERLAGLLAGTC
jgi:hypothetical protein